MRFTMNPKKEPGMEGPLSDFNLGCIYTYKNNTFKLYSDIYMDIYSVNYKATY